MEIPFKLSTKKEMKIFESRYYLLERDILKMSYMIFEIEKLIKDGKIIKEIEIPISYRTSTLIDTKALQEEIHDLFLNILFRDIKILFKRQSSSNLKDLRVNYKESDSICLFSGGVDSYVGTLASKARFPELQTVFIAHSDQQRIIERVNELNRNVLVKNKIINNTIYAPPMGRGYSQLRGLLYMLLGGIYCNITDSNNLIVSECGTTMYQPQFSPFDDFTMTTHPIVMNKAKKMLEILLERKIKIILPFENMTKAEIVKLSPQKENLKSTHSCVSGRFGQHDGTCYGCILRRIGFIASNVEDTNYYKNVFFDPTANSDNLLSLMRFCYDFLFDYDNLGDFSKTIIDVYNKNDLFRRTSLDVFSALYVLFKKTKKRNYFLDNLYDKSLESIGEDKIEKHIMHLRSKSKIPDFNKVVKTL